MWYNKQAKQKNCYKKKKDEHCRNSDQAIPTTDLTGQLRNTV